MSFRLPPLWTLGATLAVVYTFYTKYIQSKIDDIALKELQVKLKKMRTELARMKLAAKKSKKTIPSTKHEKDQTKIVDMFRKIDIWENKMGGREALHDALNERYGSLRWVTKLKKLRGIRNSMVHTGKKILSKTEENDADTVMKNLSDLVAHLQRPGLSIKLRHGSLSWKPSRKTTAMWLLHDHEVEILDSISICLFQSFVMSMQQPHCSCFPSPPSTKFHIRQLNISAQQIKLNYD
tara:strand:+ start:911 stop:1621 length:711 start_codon:yes stop_codon:yes gene_type:complete